MHAFSARSHQPVLDQSRGDFVIRIFQSSYFSIIILTTRTNELRASGHGNSGSDLINANPVGESSYAYRAAGFNFVATTTTTYITFKVSTAGSSKDIYIDNVVLQVGEKDHSPWQNNLAIKGTVPKSLTTWCDSYP